MASFTIDDELHGRLQRLADARAASPEDVVRDAVEQLLERERLRADFIAEAEESWAAFQRDGLHLTFDEMHDWLNDWGTDRAPPACHT